MRRAVPERLFYIHRVSANPRRFDTESHITGHKVAAARTSSSENPKEQLDLNKFFAGVIVLLAAALSGCDSNTAPPAEGGDVVRAPATVEEVSAVQAPPLIERSVLFRVKGQGKPTRER